MFLFSGIKPVFATVATLVSTACDIDDVADATCQTAIVTDGLSSVALSKGSHIDAPLETLTATTVNSATLYYDSWATLSGTWSIYVKDSRDGTTICSASPAPEDGSETSNSFSCTISTTQLSNGLWVQVDNDDDKGPQSVNLDYIYLSVDYTAPTISISLSTDGSISLGTIASNTAEDTTASGVNDTETISVDTGPADLDARSTTFSDGSNTWSLSTSTAADTVLWQFSPTGSTWTTFAVADTLYSLATNISQSSTQNVFFKLTTPTSTSSYSQHSTTITIVASAP